MNYNSFKLAFFNSLEDKLQSRYRNNKYDIDDTSIFLYEDQLSDFINEFYGSNTDSITQSISDFDEMDFKNGQFLMNQIGMPENNNDLVVGLLNEFMLQADILESYDKNKNKEFDKNEALNLINNLSKEGVNDNQLSINDILISSNEKPKSTKTNKQQSTKFLNEYKDILSSNDINMLTSLFDINKDGVISESEMQGAKKGLGFLDGNEQDISKKDINKIKEYIDKLKAEGLSTEEISKRIKNLKDDPTVLNSSNLNEVENIDTSKVQESSSNSSSQSNGQSSYSSSSNSSSNSGSGEKTVSNMSVKELESELKTAEQDVNDTQSAYIAELEKVDSELAGKIQETNTNIKTTESELNTANTQLAEYNSKLASDKQNLATAEGSIGSIDSNIQKLKQSSNNQDSNKGNFQSQISELEAQKSKIENETIPALQESIKKTEEEISKLNNETIPSLEEKLAKYTETLTKYEQDVEKLAGSNGTLKTQLDSYKNAVEYKKTVEQTLQSKRISQQKALNSDMPENDEASYDYRDLDGYTFKNLPFDYDLNGQTYHCVGVAGYDIDGDGKVDFKPDSWEEVQRYFDNGGVENLGKYGSMQCHNYSDMLGQFVLGDVNPEFVQALYSETNDSSYGDKDMAGKMGTDSKWNPRRFSRPEARNRDEERAIIENELQNGRPVVIGVDGGSHWVLGVGMADNGDILIWDSYDGSLEQLGRSSNDDNNDLSRNLMSKRGVMVYCDGYEYEYNQEAYYDYWSYVGNSPAYILENGYRR